MIHVYIYVYLVDVIVGRIRSLFKGEVENNYLHLTFFHTSEPGGRHGVLLVDNVECL